MGAMRRRNAECASVSMSKDILGVKIDDVSEAEALKLVEKWIRNPGRHYIVTPNPEMMGLKFSGKVKNKIAGTDFMERLVALASEKGFVTGFLGGKAGIAVKCAERLKSKYPNLKVSVASDDLNQRIPPGDLLFVALGHIKQEKWMADNINKIPVHVTMGVGGAFDYLSGSVPRAPGILRNLNLEWLFRLIIQPWRIERQLALFRYLWLLLSYDYNKNQ